MEALPVRLIYGVPRHLIVSRHWEVSAAKREHNHLTKSDEIAYLNQRDANHDILQRIRQALQLDLVAFDYSYDPAGQLVIWEANPYPNLSHPTGIGTEYTRPYVTRSFAAIAAMYLTAGGFDLHPYIIRSLESSAPTNVQKTAA